MRRLLCVSLLCFFLSAADAGGDWRFTSPMPRGRYWHDSAVCDGKIFVLGGITSDLEGRGEYDGRYSNLMYDPRSDRWEYRMAVPGRLLRKYYTSQPEEYTRTTNRFRMGWGVAVAAKDGLVYWTGGSGRFYGLGEDIVLPYDPQTDRWPRTYSKKVNYSPTAYRYFTMFHKKIPDMLERRIAHRTVVTSDGRLCAGCGFQVDRHEDEHGNVTSSREIRVLKSIECYDGETWEHMLRLDQGVYLFAAVALPGNRILVMGGLTGGINDPGTRVLDRVLLLDLDRRQVSERRPLPLPLNSHAATLGPDNKVHITGGMTEIRGRPLRHHWIYDYDRDLYEKGEPMHIPRANHSSETLDNRIYAIGGTNVGAYRSLGAKLRKKLKGHHERIQETVEFLD